MNDPRVYFPFYPADFWGALAVEQMTMEAAGLYLALLSREWQQGSIPADGRLLKRLFGARCSDWEGSWAQVSPCFTQSGECLKNRRLELERLEADAASAKQSAKAKVRWDRWRASQNATAMPRHNSGNAGAMPGEERRGEERKGAEKKERAKRAAPSALVIPSELDVPAFRAAWAEWLAYRHERHLTATPRTLQAQLVDLSAFGVDGAIGSIHASIASGWQGVFEPKKHPARAQSGASTREMLFGSPKPEPRTIDIERSNP